MIPLLNGFLFFSVAALFEPSASSKQRQTLHPFVKFAAIVGAQLCKGNCCLIHGFMFSDRGDVDSTDRESIAGAPMTSAATEVAFGQVQATEDCEALFGDKINAT